MEKEKLEKLKRKQYLKRSLHIKKAKKILRKGDYKEVWSKFYKGRHADLIEYGAFGERHATERAYFFYFMRKFLDNRYFSKTCIDFTEHEENILNLFDEDSKSPWIWDDDGASDEIFDYIENEGNFFYLFEFEEFLNFMIADTVFYEVDYLDSVIHAITRACEDNCCRGHWKSRVVSLKKRIKKACKKSGIWNKENRKKLIEWGKYLKLWLNSELSYKDRDLVEDFVRVSYNYFTEKELLEKFKDNSFLELVKNV